jgi:hypothetical protein
MDFNMRKIQLLIIVLALFTVANTMFGQAKKPTLIILPSDNWCTQRYFITEFDNQGTKQSVPNYKQAFQEDTELGQVISKIGGLMIDRGFPLKDAEQELKAIETRNAEDNMTSSKTTGSYISESPLDMLKKRAKADIVIQIWWKVNKEGAQKSISFILEAFDAYTSKRIASSTGNGESSNDIIPVQLEKAILSNINPFVTQLQKHFDDMFTNGREVLVTVKTWDDWEYDLEEEFDGEELTDIIDDWMAQNTVSGRYNMSDATESFIRFEQVRIPLYDEKNRALDARKFAKDLRKFLKSDPYFIESKLMTRGLGEAIIVLGEK